MVGTGMRLVKTITVAVLVSLTMAPIAYKATASASAASRRTIAHSRLNETTVVYGFGRHQVGWAHPEVRPSQATFGLAGEDGIKRIRWKEWRRSSAAGHGLHLLFTGTGVKDQRATIVMSVVRTHKGQRYFSHLVMRWTTKNGKHHKETLNWGFDKGVGWLWLGNFR